MYNKNTVYAVIFEGLIFNRRQVGKDFCGLFLADHQVEYIVSLSHCFFLGLKFHAWQAHSEIYVP